MADNESIIDKAIGLIPGVGTSKRPAKRASPGVQLGKLKRDLAKLTKDVEKLGQFIVKSQAKKTQPRKPVAKPGAASKNARSRVK